MEGVLEMSLPKLKKKRYRKKKYICTWCKEHPCYAKTVLKPLSCLMNSQVASPNWKRKPFIRLPKIPTMRFLK